MSNIERKMAYIAKVTGIFPIKDADRICVYEIDSGWKVVDTIGKYSVSDLVVYVSIDSWVPTTTAPFLTKPEHFPKIYNGIQGEKLRTIRLKKQISQGLILPLSVLDYVESEIMEVLIGLDVSVPLGIVKWEPPPEFASADSKGNFPSCVPKTNQERIQNFYSDIKDQFDKITFSVSEKANGSSGTFIFNNGEFAVCSRNLELKDSDNTWWNIARKYNLENKLRTLGRNIGIQGEVLGPKMNGNQYQLTDFMMLVFDIFDIDKQEYLSPKEMVNLCNDLGLQTVPILNSNMSLNNYSLDTILKMADGTSVLGFPSTKREGLVFKANTPERISFKAISNAHLLSEKD